MTKTISTLNNILESLVKIQSSAWIKEEEKWKPSRQALETYKAVCGKWAPMTFEEIESLFKPPEPVLNFSQRSKVLYLPPLEKDSHFVPVLSLYCKLNAKQSVAKLRVMLVCLDEDHKPYGIGFRLETPESMNQNANTTDNDGIHDFHHAQLIRKFGNKLDRNLPVDCPSWIPESQPSFPLPAKCPVTLLLCLIVTLYGRKYYNEFFKKDISAYRKSDIEQHKKKLDPWINWKRD